MGLVVLIAAVGLEGASSGVEVNVVAVAGLALIDEDDLSNAVVDRVSMAQKLTFPPSTVLSAM